MRAKESETPVEATTPPDPGPPPSDAQSTDAEIRDVAERLKGALEGASGDAVVESIELGRGRGRPSAPSTPTARVASTNGKPDEPGPLSGMDLGLLSSMVWDGVGDVAGWKEAGVPVDDANKEAWAEALAPVLDKYIGELAREHGPEATLVTVTLAMSLPRVFATYRFRKKKREAEASQEA